MLVTVAVAVGLLVGLSMGALGGGGSILTVPVLVYLLGMDTLSATTGSLIIVGITAVFGVLAHRRGGNVRLLQGLVFGAIGVVGAVAGTRLAQQVSSDVLLAGFSVLMLTVAALMFTRRRVPAGGTGSGAERDTIGVDVPIISFAPSFACSCPRAAKVVVAAVAVGLMTGFFGVGGGFLVVPALVLVLDFPMPAAVGTSLLIIAINSATALVARAGTGVEIDWAIIGPFTVAAVIGSLLGARVAARARPGTLQIAFAVLITVVGLYTAARSIPGLIE
ncbi:sulfite exporter TauE/SafE family protein [Nakamurella sp. GG22]